MIRSIFKALLLLFGIGMAMGIVQSIKSPAPKQAVQNISPEEQAIGRDIAARAYAVGKTLSRSGAVKPSGDQVDAMSRRMQTEMGVTSPQGWFRQHFEMGFWQGWKAQ